MFSAGNSYYLVSFTTLNSCCRFFLLLLAISTGVFAYDGAPSERRTGSLGVRSSGLEKKRGQTAAPRAGEGRTHVHTPGAPLLQLLLRKVDVCLGDQAD